MFFLLLTHACTLYMFITFLYSTYKGAWFNKMVFKKKKKLNSLKYTLQKMSKRITSKLLKIAEHMS